MAGAARGFIPVLHAATLDRPDEIDTLTAAQAVANALGELGYATEIVALGNDLARLDELKQLRPLRVFNLVDAVKGDGKLAAMVPALLDGLELAYTGCRTSAWLATLSKIATKEKLACAGLPTPHWSDDGTGLDDTETVIVKPVFEHGSLGLDANSIVSGAIAKGTIAERTQRLRTEHFAEQFIAGREFNLALIETKRGPETLPIAEILFEGFAADQPRIVGYDAKWTPDSAAYIGTPRRFGLEATEPLLAESLRHLAIDCWRLFGLGGYARIDFRVDGEGEVWILEVNVNPCLSPDAGYAAAAEEASWSYPETIGRIVEASLGELQATA